MTASSLATRRDRQRLVESVSMSNALARPGGRAISNASTAGPSAVVVPTSITAIGFSDRRSGD
jgi:hypothetical protein